MDARRFPPGKNTSLSITVSNVPVNTKTLRGSSLLGKNNSQCVDHLKVCRGLEHVENGQRIGQKLR